jgi:hypothetical protein
MMFGVLKLSLISWSLDLSGNNVDGIFHHPGYKYFRNRKSIARPERSHKDR